MEEVDLNNIWILIGINRDHLEKILSRILEGEDLDMSFFQIGYYEKDMASAHARAAMQYPELEIVAANTLADILSNIEAAS
jgi:hypothetical protein